MEREKGAARDVEGGRETKEPPLVLDVRKGEPGRLMEGGIGASEPRGWCGEGRKWLAMVMERLREGKVACHGSR